MTIAYYLWYEDGPHGPFTLAQLRAMWAAGQLTAENAFSEDGGQNWRFVSEIVEELQPKPSPVNALPQNDTQYRFSEESSSKLPALIIIGVCLILGIIGTLYYVTYNQGIQGSFINNAFVPVDGGGVVKLTVVYDFNTNHTVKKNSNNASDS